MHQNKEHLRFRSQQKAMRATVGRQLSMEILEDRRMLAYCGLTADGPLLPPSSADFNGDSAISGADFLTWQISHNSQLHTANHPSGDADNDSEADADDLVIWQQQYGQALTPVDLSITKSAGKTSLTTGQSVTYSITVTNHALTEVVGATVVDYLPSQLTNASWTAELSGVGQANLSGIGGIEETIDLAAGSSITYSLNATLAEALSPHQPAQQTLTNAVHVFGPEGTVDLDPTDNTALDADLVAMVAVDGTGVFKHSSYEQPFWDREIEHLLGDVDGDGDLDLFASDDSTFQVLLNNGNAEFTQTSPSSNYGHVYAVGDFDQDGDLDAMTKGYSEEFIVQLNDGTGSFTPNPNLLLIDRAVDVKIADLDGDGDLDAVVAASRDGAKILWNDGNANFSLDPDNIIDGYVGEISHGDFDGDGDLDIIDAYGTTPGETTRGTLWINNGSGPYTSQSIAADFSPVEIVQTGDVDNDNDLDLIALGSNDLGDTTLVVWKNDGTGEFTNTSQTMQLNHYGISDLAIGDLDGDGDLDAFLAKEHFFNLIPDEVWLNDGNGNFTDSGQRLGSNASTSAAIGDLDGDGDLDVLVAASNSHSEIPELIFLNADTDLSIEVSNGTAAVTEGEIVTYTVTVTNQGPATVTGARVIDNLPAELLNPTWTATLIGNGTANLAGAGDLDETINLTGGSSIIYTISGDLLGSLSPNQAADRFLFNAATVTAPTDALETDQTNNRDTDSDTIVLAATAGTAQFTGNGEVILPDSERLLALGDLDGDGDLDAVIKLDDIKVAVVLNDGYGSFGLPVASFEDVTEAEIGDMDNDGDLDLVLLIYLYPGNFGHVWMNDGSANFTRNSTTAVFKLYSGALKLADLNNDGNLDVLLTKSPEEAKRRVFLNDGNGALSAGAELPKGIEFASLGDVDGDGDLDMLASRPYVTNVRSVSLFINDGTGNFAETPEPFGPPHANTAELGDLDGDGDLDAFITSRLSFFGPRGNQVWLNDGLGTFVDSGQFLVPDGISSPSLGDTIKLGDLDGDGDLDSIVSNYNYTIDEMWLNDGHGTFSYTPSDTDTLIGASGVIGDLDGDGDLDISNTLYFQDTKIHFNGTPIDLAITQHSQTTSVVEGSTVTYTIEVTNLSEADVFGATVEDYFDITLLSDIRLTSISAQGDVTSQQTIGPLQDSLSDTIDLPGGASITYVVSARVIESLSANQGVDRILSNLARVVEPQPFEDFDITNNTAIDEDLVFISATGGFANFEVGFRLPAGEFPFRNPWPLAVGDLDGDGDLDFLRQDKNGGVVYLNDGTGQMAKGQLLPTILPVWQAHLGDIDGDGDLDALLLSDSYLEGVWFNNGDGTFVHSGTKLQQASRNAALADFDNDGDLDLLFRNGQVLVNSGSGQFNSQAILPSGLNIAVADVDNDGDLDVLYSEHESPRGDALFLNDGKGNLDISQQALPIDSKASYRAKFADLDTDGDLDLILHRSQGSYILSNDGNGVFTNTGQVLGTDSIPADFDGDGDLDLYSVRSGEMWLNDGSGVFFVHTNNIFKFSACCVPLLGDFDGDGDIDFLTQYRYIMLNEPSAPSADYDEDGDIDGADFLAWQRGFGKPNPAATKSDGDADNDFDVDAQDLAIWQQAYGTTPILAPTRALPPSAAVQAASSPSLNAGLIDAAIAIESAEIDGSVDSDDEQWLNLNQPINEKLRLFSTPKKDRTGTLAQVEQASNLREVKSLKQRLIDPPWLSDELLERAFD